MCGIIVVGNYLKKLPKNDEKVIKMANLLKYRGPDQEGFLWNSHCLMAHRRLSIIDLKTGNQPLTYTYQGKKYHIVYNGEIYNMIELKNKLITLGYSFNTTSDTEVLLVSFIEWKEKCLNYLEGIFALAIDDGEKLFLARDPLGVKPLFYYIDDHTLVAASEIKCLLSYIGEAVVDRNGIKELLGLGPSITPGYTIYKNIYSLRPGYYMYFDTESHIHQYWKLKDEEHTDNLFETIDKVRELVIDSIQKQLLSDVPLSTMLSGGLDSSIITAIASQYTHHLSTYSITYEDQEKYFQSYAYQTTMDDEFIDKMVKRYKTDHHKVTLTQKNLADSLKESLIARDMPGMADVDSSFLLFSQNISNKHKVCLSGECADEIFGGYPWFYKEELYNLPYFPWMRDLDLKLDLFNEKVKSLNLKQFIIQRYQDTLHEIQTNDKNKQLIYLNTQWFMQTLLARADSQTMRSSIEVRVPFASIKILQYLYNMPLEYMFYGDEEKGILRKAFEMFLPEDISHRKKNPYPKTHSPIYAHIISRKLKETLNDSSNILYDFFDKNKLIEFVESEGKSFQSPWFGQLMMGPQLMAYFYQIYLWGKIYHIKLEF